jgi:hypothetical protein
MLDIEFTKTWWRGVVADPAKTLKWLIKLEFTEWQGGAEHYDFLVKHPELSEREERILRNIADDESKHSLKLLGIIKDRGGNPAIDSNSTYWDTILTPNLSFQDYCAANFYGEQLAAWRFEVIRSIPETPKDIKDFIDFALPDEIFHRETLQRLAGEESLAKFKSIHDNALSALLKK